jgi:Fe-S cluster assembly ATP-binding protein
MAARTEEDVSVLEVRVLMTEWMERLGMDKSFASRHLNQGFSGGEKKRNEILQMALLKPRVAVLDETDSGLDIDALRVVGRGVHAVRRSGPSSACSPSPTTSGCSMSSSPTSCISWSTGAS